MSSLAKGLSCVALLAACGGVQTPVRGLSADAVVARRVVHIMQARHVSPPKLDDALSSRLFERLLADPTLSGCRDAGTRFVGERQMLDEALWAGDFSFVVRLAEHCHAPPLTPGQARARMLDAFAKLHDPHSAYLTEAALRIRRQAVHAPAASLPRVRARVIDQAGVKVGVLRVPEFYLRADGSVSRDSRALLARMRQAGVQVLLVDLRHDGGGVESEALSFVGLLAGPGPVVFVARADGAELLQSHQTRAFSGPIVVAIDAGTASVAEVTAAALQDRLGAVVVGQQSHGKGTGQTWVLLSSPRNGRDGAVQVTDRRYHRLDGRPLQRDGVRPDVVIERWRGASVVTERTRPGALRFSPIASAGPAPRAPAPAAAGAGAVAPGGEDSALVRAVIALVRTGALDGLDADRVQAH